MVDVEEQRQQIEKILLTLPHGFLCAAQTLAIEQQEALLGRGDAHQSFDDFCFLHLFLTHGRYRQAGVKLERKAGGKSPMPARCTTSEGREAVQRCSSRPTPALTDTAWDLPGAASARFCFWVWSGRWVLAAPKCRACTAGVRRRSARFGCRVCVVCCFFFRRPRGGPVPRRRSPRRSPRRWGNWAVRDRGPRPHAHGSGRSSQCSSAAYRDELIDDESTVTHAAASVMSCGVQLACRPRLLLYPMPYRGVTYARRTRSRNRHRRPAPRPVRGDRA